MSSHCIPVFEQVHHQPLQDLPVDKRRHQEPLWRENLQSGGNPRKTFSTDSSAVLESRQTIVLRGITCSMLPASLKKSLSFRAVELALRHKVSCAAGGGGVREVVEIGGAPHIERQIDGAPVPRFIEEIDEVPIPKEHGIADVFFACGDDGGPERSGTKLFTWSASLSATRSRLSTSRLSTVPCRG